MWGEKVGWGFKRGEQLVRAIATVVSVRYMALRIRGEVVGRRCSPGNTRERQACMKLVF